MQSPTNLRLELDFDTTVTTLLKADQSGQNTIHPKYEFAILASNLCRGPNFATTTAHTRVGRARRSGRLYRVAYASPRDACKSMKDKVAEI